MAGIGPYNTVAKAKVTLSFANLLYKPKLRPEGGLAGCRLSAKSPEKSG
jgi:hypothetical protein